MCKDFLKKYVDGKLAKFNCADKDSEKIPKFKKHAIFGF